MAISGKTLIVVSHQFSEGKTSAFDQVVNLTPAA